MVKPSNKRKKRKKGGSNSDVDLDSSAISNEDHKDHQPENRCAQDFTKIVTKLSEDYHSVVDDVKAVTSRLTITKKTFSVLKKR